MRIRWEPVCVTTSIARRVYLGGGLDLNRFRWKGGEHLTEWGLGIEAGYAYFLSRTVTVEPAVYYKWRFNDSDLSQVRCKDRFRVLLLSHHIRFYSPQSTQRAQRLLS